jgi:probable addiction module antidote protein
MAAYLEACFEEADGDAAFVAKALGDIARAKGMSHVARDAGLSRESLYKALSGVRSPDFHTILEVMGALGLRFLAEPAQDRSVAIWRCVRLLPGQRHFVDDRRVSRAAYHVGLPRGRSQGGCAGRWCRSRFLMRPGTSERGERCR